MLIHSRLYDLQKKYVNELVVKVALLWCNSAAITTQYLYYCVVIAPLLDCKSGTLRALCVFEGYRGWLLCPKKPEKQLFDSLELNFIL